MKNNLDLKKAIENDLYNNIIKFTDLLIDQFPNNEDIVAYKTLITKFFSPETLIQEFCKHVLPYKDDILSHNKNKLLEELKKDETLFYQLTKIMNDPSFSEEDIDNTWKWMDKFIKLGLKYQSLSK